MPERLGYLQQHMLQFCLKHPGLHTIAPDAQTVRVARSLERRGLLQIVDCGMCTASGRAVYMVRAVLVPRLPGESVQAAASYTGRPATGAQLPPI